MNNRQIFGSGWSGSLCLVLCCLPVQALWAQAWNFAPELSLGGVYNDNYRLEPDNQTQLSGAGAELDLRAALERISPTGRFGIVPRVRITQYEDSELDDLASEDFYLTLESYKRFQRAEWEGELRYSRESVLNSELPEFGEEEPGFEEGEIADTGVLRVQNTRERIYTPLEIAFDITERNQIVLGGSWKDISFEEEQGTDLLRDFQETRLLAGYRYLFSPQDSIMVSAAAGRFEPIDSPATDSYELRATWERQASQNWQLFATGGVTATRFDLVVDGVREKEEDTRPLLYLSAVRAFETTRLKLDLGNRVRGNARGFLVDRREAAVGIDKLLTPHVVWKVSGRAFKEESVDTVSAGGDRTQWRVGTGLSWQFSPAWALEGEYRHTFQDIEAEMLDAESNAVFLSIVYRRLRPREFQ